MFLFIRSKSLTNDLETIVTSGACEIGRSFMLMLKAFPSFPTRRGTTPSTRGTITSPGTPGWTRPSLLPPFLPSPPPHTLLLPLLPLLFLLLLTPPASFPTLPLQPILSNRKLQEQRRCRPKIARPGKGGNRDKNRRSSGTENAAKTDGEPVRAVANRSDAPGENFLLPKYACVSIYLSFYTPHI